MTRDEAVDFAAKMRAVGVRTLKFDGLELELLPPEPPRLTAIAEAMGELPIEEREKLIEQAKKDIDRDLYGAS